MNHTSAKSEKKAIDRHQSNSPWRTILHLAAPYRLTFLAVLLVAGLSTAANLIEPLIYRAAVNDVAGLFVERAREEGRQESEAASAKPQTQAETSRRAQERKRRLESVREPHQRGRVAPRTPSQTFSTLLWAVSLLFAINVVGYFFTLLSDNMTASLGSRIEKRFIYRAFDHTLRLPLSFFARHASGALAKRIDQLDQVSPIVNAFAMQIAPEAIRCRHPRDHVHAKLAAGASGDRHVAAVPSDCAPFGDSFGAWAE